MDNYSNKQGQAGIMEKNRGFNVKSEGVEKIEEGIKSVTNDVKSVAHELQNKMKHRKEQAGEWMCAVNKKVHANPWTVIAGIAVGSFVLGSLIKFKR